MSATIGFVNDGSKFLFLVRRIKTVFVRNPEWWVWVLSLLVWLLLVADVFAAAHEKGNSRNFIYCTPEGAAQITIHPANELQSILQFGLLPWILMVIAMMYPLVIDPVRHVAFSIKRKDRDLGIASFLLGYTITWTIAGIFFLSLLFFLDTAIGDRTPLTGNLIQLSGFLFAAVLVWLPGRLKKMAKCKQTMPICIHGWRLYRDSLHFGLQTGFSCLNICWAIMAALMLIHHNVVLMFMVTIVLIYERYLIPHTNRFPGYAWAVLGVAFFLLKWLPNF